MDKDTPKYINCALCSAQSTLAKTQTKGGLMRYVCPAKHNTFVLEQDFVYNDEEREDQ